ncbi:MAG: KH domain-containing protein [Candidatus ainarchaeum sp.]|nr:KH domain-containing protein [Candidatus ainarchaeum sp.]
MEILRIPKERLGALRGAKAEIEKHYTVTLVLGEDGEIEIGGETVWTYLARDVVRAIGRGFSPSEAVKLFKDDYSFYLIDLREHFSTENAMRRVKGRIIGEKGKVKAEIEQATGSDLCIYGHTVGIIAPSDAMEYVKDAIGMIMDGAPLTTIAGVLARARESIRFGRLKG